MWICRIGEHKTTRRGNIIRHLKLVHSIDDRDGKNVSKVSNKNEGVLSYGKVQTSNDTYGQHSTMIDKGRHMSEDYREPPYEVSQLRMEAPLTKDKYEDEPRSISEQEFRTIRSELRATKCHILDDVLECIPEHMKAKARCICNILKRLDLFFVNRHHKIIFDGEKLKGSNIHSLIEEILLCCPTWVARIQIYSNIWIVVLRFHFIIRLEVERDGYRKVHLQQVFLHYREIGKAEYSCWKDSRYS